MFLTSEALIGHIKSTIHSQEKDQPFQGTTATAPTTTNDDHLRVTNLARECDFPVSDFSLPSL
uniref:C2H2-type domain-containing protein n=1 Tax=Mesocestoides corti TaxID=53468 RepID=A0A5K3F5Y0_MESCO